MSMKVIYAIPFKRSQLCDCRRHTKRNRHFVEVAAPSISSITRSAKSGLIGEPVVHPQICLHCMSLYLKQL